MCRAQGQGCVSEEGGGGGGANLLGAFIEERQFVAEKAEGCVQRILKKKFSALVL